MPAAAVIPAPIAYIKVVAVKKLVVERVAGARGGPWPGCGCCRCGGRRTRVRRNPGYCEEIRVFKAGERLDTSAWNNKIGLRSACWLGGQSNG